MPDEPGGHGEIPPDHHILHLLVFVTRFVIAFAVLLSTASTPIQGLHDPCCPLGAGAELDTVGAIFVGPSFKWHRTGLRAALGTARTYSLDVDVAVGLLVIHKRYSGSHGCASPECVSGWYRQGQRRAC
jgi:hypothetical protein